MTTVSDDIKDMLENTPLLGLVFANNLFIGKIPDKPNFSVTIFDTPGYNSLTLDRKSYEYPSIQITIRSSAYNDAMAWGHKIVSTLHGRAQETWNGVLYSSIRCSSGPALLEWDENGHAKVIINFNIQRRSE